MLSIQKLDNKYKDLLDKAAEIRSIPFDISKTKEFDNSAKTAMLLISELRNELNALLNSKNMLSAILLFSMPGGGEWVLILIAVLVLFGGKKIPELMKGVGQGIREFNDAKDKVKTNIEEGMKKENTNPPTSTN